MGFLFSLQPVNRGHTLAEFCTMNGFQSSSRRSDSNGKADTERSFEERGKGGGSSDGRGVGCTRSLGADGTNGEEKCHGHAAHAVPVYHRGIVRQPAIWLPDRVPHHVHDRATNDACPR